MRMLKQTCRNLWRHGVGFSQQNVEFQFNKTLVLIFMQTNKWKSSAKPLCIWLYKLIGYSPPIFGVKMLRSSSIEFRVRREWNVPKTICTSLRRYVFPFVNGRYHFYDT